MSAEPIKAGPGGQRNIRNTVTTMVRTQGIAQAHGEVKLLSSAVDLLRKSSKNLAKDTTWKDLAKHPAMLEMEIERVSGVHGEFVTALKRAGNDLAKLTKEEMALREEAQKGHLRLTKAIVNAEEEIQGLVIKSIPDLALKNKLYEEMEPAAQKVLKSQKEQAELQEKYQEISKEFKESWFDPMKEEFPKLWKNVAAECDDAGKVMEIFGDGVGRAWDSAKKLWGLLTKVSEIKSKFKSKSEVGESNKKGIIDRIKQVRQLFGATKKTGGAMKNMGQKTASMGKGLSKTAGVAGKSSKVMGGLSKSLGGVAAGAARGGGAIARFVVGLAGMGPPGWIAIAVIIAITVALAALYVAIKLAAEGFKKAVDMQNKYYESAWRAQGSIRELTHSALDMNIAVGVGTEKIQKMQSAMLQAGVSGETLKKGIRDINGNMLTGMDALEATTEAAVKFQYATGASAEQTAMFSKHIVNMGKSVDATMGRLTIFAKMGLTGADLDKVLNGLNKNMIALQKQLGKRFSLDEYTKSMGSLAVAAKQAGVDISVAVEAMDDVVKANDKALAIAAMGGGLKALLDPGATIEERVAAHAAGMDKISELVANKGAAIRNRILRRFKVSDEELKMWEFRKELAEIDPNRLAQMDADAEAEKALNKNFAEATKTLTMGLKQLLEPVMSFAAKFMEPFVNALTEMGKFLSQSETVKALWNEVNELFEAMFGTSLDSAEGLKETFLAVGQFIIDFIITPMKRFVWLIKWSVRTWNKLPNVVKTVAKFIMAGFVNPIMSVIYGIYKLYAWIRGKTESDFSKNKEAKRLEEEAKANESAVNKSIAEKAKKRMDEINKHKVRSKVRSYKSLNEALRSGSMGTYTGTIGGIKGGTAGTKAGAALEAQNILKQRKDHEEILTKEAQQVAAKAAHATPETGRSERIISTKISQDTKQSQTRSDNKIDRIYDKVAELVEVGKAIRDDDNPYLEAIAEYYAELRASDQQAPEPSRSRQGSGEEAAQWW